MSLEDRLYPLLAWYERLPHSIQRAAGVGFRCLPERIRRGKNFPTFERLARSTPSMDEAAVRSYQESEIHAQLETAWRHCPAYRSAMEAARVTPADFRSLEDLSKFPTLDREGLVGRADAFRNQSLPRSDALRLTTGGSTGQPVAFYLQKGISRPKEQAFLSEIWKTVGYRDGARVAVLRGGTTSPSPDGPISRYDAVRDWLILSSYHLTDRRVDDYLSALNAFRPAYLLAYPSTALELQALMERRGARLGFQFRGLLCGSERLTTLQRRSLEQFFACPVAHWYGHSERVVLAVQNAGEFAFYPTYGYTEFGPADGDGLREIIGTSFHNRLMPFIRYRTGDYAAGVAALRAREIAGRSHEFLVARDGRRISLTALNMHDDVFDGLAAVQFVQSTPGAAELLYLPLDGFDPARRQSIIERLRAKLGADFELTLRATETLERTSRGKHIWLRSTLPQATNPATPSS